MAEVEADGVVVSLDGGQTYKFYDGSGSFSLTDLAEQPTPYVARAAGPAFEGSTLPALTAPDFAEKPRITANSSTVGTILPGDNGVWKGNPAPTLSRIFYLRNGTVIPNQNGNTLPTTGFEARDEIVRAVEIKSTIDGQEFKAIGYSDPFTLTAQEALLAVDMDLKPVGQQSSITFNGSIEAKDLSVTQGGTALTTTRVGNSDEWTFVLVNTQPVSISATKVGYSPYSVVIENVEPAEPVIFATANNTAEISNATETTVSFPMIITAPPEMAGTLTLNPADGTSGPVVELQPAISGTGGVGQTLTLVHGGIYGTHEETVSLDVGWPDGSDGNTYIVRPEDAGTSVYYAGDVFDTRGSTPVQSNGIAIPASVALAAGVTPIGLFSGTNTTNVTSKDITVNLGPADPNKVILAVVIGGPGAPGGTAADLMSAKLIVDGVEYAGTGHVGEYIGSTKRRLRAFSIPCPVGGQAVLRVGTQQTAWPLQAYVLAGKDLTVVDNVSLRIARTALQALSLQRNTQPGDHIISAMIANVPKEGGLFTPIAGINEIMDTPVASEFQMFIGTRVAAAGTTTTSAGAAPSEAADCAAIMIVMREA